MAVVVSARWWGVLWRAFWIALVHHFPRVRCSNRDASPHLDVEERRSTVFPLFDPLLQVPWSSHEMILLWSELTSEILPPSVYAGWGLWTRAPWLDKGWNLNKTPSTHFLENLQLHLSPNHGIGKTLSGRTWTISKTRTKSHGFPKAANCQTHAFPSIREECTDHGPIWLSWCAELLMLLVSKGTCRDMICNSVFHDAFDRTSKLKLKHETDSKGIDIVSQGFGLLSILEMVDVTGSLSHWFFIVFNIFKWSIPDQGIMSTRVLPVAVCSMLVWLVPGLLDNCAGKGQWMRAKICCGWTPSDLQGPFS